MSLWHETIAIIDAHRRHPDVGEAILQAAFLFEKARMIAQLEKAPERGNEQGWTEEVIAAPVDLAARDQLLRSLQQLATERPDHPDIGGLYWALGKTGDRTIVPFLRRGLREQLRRSPDAVYQILIALDNLGERPFPVQSTSLMNRAENAAFAEAYLTRSGADPADAG